MFVMPLTQVSREFIKVKEMSNISKHFQTPGHCQSVLGDLLLQLNFDMIVNPFTDIDPSYFYSTVPGPVIHLCYLLSFKFY